MTRRVSIAWGGVVCLSLAFTFPVQAQSPSPTKPVLVTPGTGVPGIDITNFGGAADAQISTAVTVAGPMGAVCSTSAGGTTLSCGHGIFAPADAGKAIEIPGAGGTLMAPTTMLNSIVAVGNLDTDGLYRNATLVTPFVNNATNVPVTWGTDNTPPFKNAVASGIMSNGCPVPSNGSGPLGGFSSKGCVIYFPNPGAGGTGDYMFSGTVTLGSQTSFEIIGMGNSGKWEQSAQAGVRFITAMPITILQINQLPPVTVFPNLGGFRMENITFKDTSGNGSAIGGLLMNAVSEAEIAHCSFEDFSGQQANAQSNTTELSYGMKAVTYGGASLFNNNITLRDDKGKNNSIWYDGSNGAQDGPIVIGGDIFPTNNQSGTPPSGPWTNSCLGIVSSGVIRLYGTHFDVGQDKSGNNCIGVEPLGGGIVSGKFESTAVPGSQAGMGVVVAPPNASASTVNLTTTNISKTNNVVTVTASNSFVAGQTVNISHTNSTDQTNLDGTFLITSASSTQFTYDYPGTNYPTPLAGGTATGRVTFSLDVEGSFNNLSNDVTINAGARNNRIVDFSSANDGMGSHSLVTDSGTNDNVQVFSGMVGNSTSITGALTVPVTSGLAPTVDGSLDYDPGQIRYAAGSNGQAVSFPKVLCAFFATTDNHTATTTMEQAFSTTCPIPKNELIANKVIRVTINFQAIAGTMTPTTITIRLRQGSSTGTLIYNPPGPSATLAGTKNSPSTFYLAGTAAAGSTATVNTTGFVPLLGGNAQNGQNGQTSAITLATNAIVTLVPTVQFTSNTDPTNEVDLKMLLVEALN